MEFTPEFINLFAEINRKAYHRRKAAEQCIVNDANNQQSKHDTSINPSTSAQTAEE